MSIQFVRALGVLGLLGMPLLIPISLVNAADPTFDVSMSAPAELSAEDLKGRLRNHFAKHAQRDQAELTRDSSASADFDEMRWQLQELINKRRPLGDLREVGLSPRGNGSVEADLKRFPQWSPLHDRLLVLRTPSAFDSYVPGLRRRGFRDQDLAAMREYLQANDTERMTFFATKSLVENYAALVQSRNGMDVPIPVAKAFHYRLGQSANEVRRKWAAGLLDSLDRQRQRILVSMFQETLITTIVGPDEDVEGVLRREMAFMRTDAFRQAMRQKEMEYQQ